MASKVFVVSLLLAAIVTPTRAYESFRDSIPNGHMVPSPCSDGTMWNGVGHEDQMGGGDLNPFGEDFKAWGYWWNQDICKLDSDGDGLTNGQELGDPSCMWYKDGPAPERTYNISHPGVCEPRDSDKCKGANDFLECEEKYECPQINQTDVIRFPMALDETEIPAKDVSTFCKIIDIPSDQDYYVIASEATIGNMENVGSVVVFGCGGDQIPDTDGTRECEEADTTACPTIIGYWSFGRSDMCFGDNGFRVGLTRIQKVLLQVMYYNPDKKTGMMDQSGMAVYVKPAPTDQSMDLRTLILGTMLMEIPPGDASYEVENVCKGTCTSAMVMSPAKIWGALNAMGPLGTAMHIQVFRGGEKVADVTWEDDYDHMKPELHRHEPSLDLWPGDEIKTTCVYNTMDTSSYTRAGEGAKDEACYGFIMAYPYSAFSFDACLSYGELDICELFTGTPLSTSKGQCYWYDFTRSSDDYTPSWMTDVGNYCSEDGYCRQTCKDTVSRLVEQEPCLTKEASLLVNWQLEEQKSGHRAMATLNTCRGVIYSDDDDHSDDTCSWEDCYYYCDDGHYDAAPSVVASAMLIAVSLGFAMIFRA